MMGETDPIYSGNDHHHLFQKLRLADNARGINATGAPRKTDVAMEPGVYSAIGLILNLVGLIVLFRYGWPYPASAPNRAAINNTSGKVGVVLLVLGTVAQIA